VTKPPKEWFYAVVRKIEKEAPDIENPSALAGWIWYHHMKPATKKAILKATKLGRKYKLGIRKITARLLKKWKVLDPDSKLKIRKHLIKQPKVIMYDDYEGYGLIRVLMRADKTNFPEFAITMDEWDKELEKSLQYAGLKQVKKDKWVLRTNKFNLFVYTA